MRARSVIEDRPRILGLTIVVVVLTLFSTRLILLMLQWEVPLVKDVARWFYLTKYGRWRLFRKYRQTVLGNQEYKSVTARGIDDPDEVAEDRGADPGHGEEGMDIDDVELSMAGVVWGGVGESALLRQGTRPPG